MMAKLAFIIYLFFAVNSIATAGHDTKSNLSHSGPQPFNAFNNIYLVGSTQHIQKLHTWLSEIMTTAKGQRTLEAINQSGHILTIKHAFSARLSAGRTIAPMTENLINHTGESVTIIFDADSPEKGTHRVFNKHFQLIEFTAVQNLYHELAHAMHKMQGTWRYFASEAQAIEEENIFRTELAKKKNQTVALRFGKDGEKIGGLETATELQVSLNQ
ncbi:M91 family zinc metallopeptidase [Eionea flava]